MRYGSLLIAMLGLLILGLTHVLRCWLKSWIQLSLIDFAGLIRFAKQLIVEFYHIIVLRQLLKDKLFFFFSRRLYVGVSVGVMGRGQSSPMELG